MQYKSEWNRDKENKERRVMLLTTAGHKGSSTSGVIYLFSMEPVIQTIISIVAEGFNECLHKKGVVYIAV